MTQRDYLISSFEKYFTNNLTEKNINESYEYLAKICSYSFPLDCINRKSEIIMNAVNACLKSFKENNDIPLLQVQRKLIATKLNDDISKFYQIFNSNDINLPLLDSSTLSLLSRPVDVFNCINFKLINSQNIKTYLEYIQEMDIKINDIELCVKKLNEIPNLPMIPDVHNLLFPILFKNKIYDDKLFLIIYNGYLKEENTKQIIQFVENIDILQISDDNLIKIDALVTNEIKQQNLLKLLESKNLLTSALYSRITNNNYLEFNFDTELFYDNIYDSAKLIFAKDKNVIIEIRRKCITEKCNYDKIQDLYYEPYPFVTQKEVEEVNTKNLYWVTDFERIDKNNCIILSNYCNIKKLSGNDIYDYFKTLFFHDDTENRITNDDVIWTIFENIDFTVIKFQSLSDDNIAELVKILSPIIELNNFDNSIKFLKAVKCHIDSLDQVIQNECQDSDVLTQYIDCINIINKPSKKVIDFIGTHNIDTALNVEITNGLYQEQQFIAYIIGKSLKDKTAFYDDNISLKYYYVAFKQSKNYSQLLQEGNQIIDLFYKNELYDSDLSIQQINLYRHYRQPIKLVKLIMSKLSTDIDKKNYLKNISHFNTYKDAQEFIPFITSDENIKLFVNDNEFTQIIKEKLWERPNDNSNKNKGVLKRQFTNKLKEKGIHQN